MCHGSTTCNEKVIHFLIDTGQHTGEYEQKNAILFSQVLFCLSMLIFFPFKIPKDSTVTVRNNNIIKGVLHPSTKMSMFC